MSQFLHIPGIAVPAAPAVLSDAVVWLDAGNTSSWNSGDATFVDLSGNSNDITVYNSPTYNSGQGGNMIFNGTNNYCDGNISFTMTSGVITMEMWFKPISLSESTWWNFMNYGNKNGSVGAGGRLFYGLRYLGSLDGATTQTYRDTFYQVGNTEEKFTPNLTITTGTWNHWVSTRDNTDIKNYINGTLVRTTTHQFNPTDSYWSNVDLTLGSKDTVTAYWNFASTITRMYEKKLTATEVTDIFNWEKTRHGL
jgi:hypothetical protein